MTFTNYLKAQLTDFVDCYKIYFKKIYGIAVVFTVICFIISILFFRLSEFDYSSATKQISLLSYFFHRYSKAGMYSIVDLTKTVFIFFVALYSLGISRLPNTPGNTDLSFSYFVRSIKGRDILLLIAAFIASSIMDFALFKFDSLAALHVNTENAKIYVRETSFHLRIYIPLILFALAIRSLTSASSSKLSLKRMVFLYISLWLFNEFAYEFSLWVRAHLFGLILMPFASPEAYYFAESIAGIPLIAFYFLGYQSAMTTPLKLTDQYSLVNLKHSV